MTHDERNIAIKKLLAEHTAKATVSRKAAREALIRTGIYTKKGKLRVEFGGESKKAKPAA